MKITNNINSMECDVNDFFVYGGVEFHSYTECFLYDDKTDDTMCVSFKCFEDERRDKKNIMFSLNFLINEDNL